MVNPHDDPIELRSSRYEVWRERFADERDRVTDAVYCRTEVREHSPSQNPVTTTDSPRNEVNGFLADSIATEGLEECIERIEHVGSTAVPGLPAKDIVDLDIVVADDAVPAVSRALETRLGGTRYENTDTWHPVFRSYDGQRFNDHVFAVSGDKWKISVVTRTVLCARPDIRTEYERLKRELVADHDDLATYSEGKTAFVERVLRIGREDDDITFGFAVPTAGKQHGSDGESVFGNETTN